MALQFHAQFKKKDSSILLTRTFNTKDTENVTEDIAHIREIYEVVGWKDPPVSLDVGRALFFLLNGENDLLKCALKEADHQGQPLQIFIQGEDIVPDVPFELVYESQFITLSRAHMIHYVSEYGCKRQVEPQDCPLEILFMACSPEGVKPVLDYEEEEETILEVSEKLPVEVDVEDTGSLQGLEECLRKRYDVVHISGHASIVDGVPVFLMEDEEGYPVHVTPDELRKVLNLNLPRLLFLSGCRTGEAPPHEAAISFAHQLVLGHSPTVLGWGFSVSDPVATTAATRIYFELGRGNSILDAVLAAREEVSKKFPDWPLLRVFSDGTPLDPPLVSESQKATVKARTIQYAYLKNKQVKVLEKGFVGRRRQIQRGLRALKHDKEKVGVLLHGTGGLGKSCLAGKLCLRLQDHVLIVVHGKLRESTLLEAVKDALIQTRDEWGWRILEEQKEMTEKIKMLCLSSFQQGKYLLVLDDFDENLTGYEQGTPAVSEEAAPLLGMLLQYLPLAVKNTQLIITSRYTFPLLVDRDLVGERLEFIGLTSFRGADERKKVYGLKNIWNYPDPEVRQELIEAGRGNPRLMEELDTLVTVDQEVMQLLQAIKGKQEEFVQQLILKKILHSQPSAFQETMQVISVYRLSVTEEGLSLVCSGIPDWKSHVDTGVSLGLLEEDRRRVSYYWMTPLLREDLFTALDENTRMACNRAAVKYYQNSLSHSFIPDYAYELIDHAFLCGMIEPAVSVGWRLLQYLRVNLLYESALRLGSDILSKVSDFGSDKSSSQFFFEFGWLLHDVGDSRRAIEYYEKALKIDRRIYGENHPDVARTYNNLGLAWHTLGDSKKAIEYFEKALKIDREIYGENHPAVAIRYNNLGLAWNDLGDSEKAIEYYEKALKIVRRIYGENHLVVATYLNNLGGAWYTLGDSEKAIEYYEKALKIDREIYGENRPDVAIDLCNLGGAWYTLGDSKKAIEYLRKSHRIFREIYGDQHPHTKVVKQLLDTLES